VTYTDWDINVAGAQGPTGGIPEAPVDSNTYGRQNAAWAQVAAKSYVDNTPALNNVGRNLLHNSLFNIQQRGAGPWTASAYTADRWSMNIAAPDTATFAIYGVTDGIRSQAGDEAMRFFLECNFTGTATGQTQLNQEIEGVRRLANKTVTLSFYAQAGVAGTKLEFVFTQSFGTGGSASAAVYISAPSVTLTTAMARYSLTLALPSIAGKTLGTNGDDFTQVIFLFNQGAGGFIQSGIVNLWGIQLEVGSVATLLEKPDPQQDLAKCQRFYQTGNFRLILYQLTGTSVGVAHPFPVIMRASPTVVPNYTVNSNVTGPSVAWDNTMLFVSATVITTGAVVIGGGFTASADL
jgi:hypothetical protein